MHIILLILQIIGIVLLIILGVLLFLLGLILFVPVRYKANFEREEDIFLKAVVSWLFPLFIVTAAYENEVLFYTIRIFGIVIYPRRKRTRKKKKSKKESKEPELVVTQIGSDSISDEETIGIETLTNETKMQQKIEKNNKKLEEKINQKAKRKESRKDNNPEHNNLKDTLFLIIDFIKVDENKKGLFKIWISLKGILKHLLPNKLSGRLIFGTGDPCSTGQILGVIGIFYARYGNQFVVVPDFEQGRLEGEIFIKGRIRVFTLLRICIKLLIDNNFKSLKRNFDKLKEAL